MTFAERLFPRIFSYVDPDSFVNRCRRRRSALIWERLQQVPPSGGLVRILDVGGCLGFWYAIGLPDPSRYHVTLLNLSGGSDDGLPGFSAVQGDACDLPYRRGEFDVVLSNSVIEHVGGQQNMRRMAGEIVRLCDNYIVQTPSFWFPFEPHAQLPFFHYLPPVLGGILIKHFNIRGFPRGGSLAECSASFRNTKMLTRKSLQSLFPVASIHTERLMGVTKSYVAIHGFQEQ